MAGVYNGFEGGTDGVAISTSNSGGASGTAFSAIFGTGFTFSAADATAGVMGAKTAGSAIGAGQSTLASVSQCAAQMMFTMKTLSTSDAHLMYFSDATGRIFSVHVNSVGKLRVSDATGTAPGLWTSATVLTAGQPYFLNAFAQGGTTTSNGIIKFVYYVGHSTTPAETMFTTTTANLGASRPFTKVLEGKMTSSAEAYGFDEFGFDPAATDLMPLPGTPATIIVLPSFSLGEFASPAPTVSATVSATVVAVPAASAAGAVPAVISAEADAVGTTVPGSSAAVLTPSLSIGSGATVAAVPAGSSSSLPPATVVPGTDVTVTTVMTVSAAGGFVAPSLALTSTDVAALSGSGTLSGASTVIGTSSLSGSGTLAATAAPTVSATGSLSGSGSLSATVKPTVLVGAALSGSGTLVAGAYPVAVASFNGSGTLTLTSAVSVAAVGLLAGTGTLTGTAFLSTATAAALSGDGVLFATAGPTHFEFPSLSAAGTLSVTADVHFTDSGILSGSGALTAGAVIGLITTTATLTGSGVLAGAAGLAQASASAALGGTGTLHAASVLVGIAAGVLTGSGLLAVIGFTEVAYLDYEAALPGPYWRAWMPGPIRRLKGSTMIDQYVLGTGEFIPIGLTMNGAPVSDPTNVYVSLVPWPGPAPTSWTPSSAESGIVGFYGSMVITAGVYGVFVKAGTYPQIAVKFAGRVDFQ